MGLGRRLGDSGKVLEVGRRMSVSAETSETSDCVQ